MKLIHLKITALGPYKDNQIIEFTELEDRKLFVISGATGAGKTTIFDAITFALYGTASGADRENVAMLRSHFADDNQHTAVELTFRLHKRKYRILRQMGHIKKGNKTKTGDRYEFFEITETGEVPVVDRQMVTEINEKVETLIGLTVEQFKQIVMLPQGEFRELLTSGTENKEEILRRIFQTKRYQSMNEILHHKLQLLQQQFVNKEQELNRYIDSIHTSLTRRTDSKLFNLLDQEQFQINQIINYLRDESVYYEEHISQDELLYKKSIDAYEHQQKRTAYAQVINDKFDQLEKKASKVKQLLLQEEEIKQTELTLKAAERASHIEPYEVQLKDRKTETKVATTQVKENEQLLQQAKILVNQAQDNYRREEQRANVREKLTEKLLVYETYIPTVETMQTVNAEIETVTLQLESINKEITSLSKRLKENETDLNDKKELSKQLESNIKGLANEKIKHSELQIEYKWWNSLVKEYNRYKQLKEAYANKKQSFERATKQLSVVEKQWLEQQAAVLAQSLVDGEACPVCGSTHHPDKQHDEGDFISDEQLEKHKEVVQQLQKIYHESHSKLTSAHDSINQIKEHIGINSVTLEDAMEKRESIITKGMQVKLNIETLEKQEQQLNLTRTTVDRLEATNKELINEKETFEKQAAEKQIQKATKIATFKESIRKIPEQFHQLKSLQQTISETKSLKEKLENDWKHVMEQLKQAETTLTTRQVQLENSKTHLTNVEVNMQKAAELFQTHVVNAQFDSIDDYMQAKLTENEREKLKKRIDEYHQLMATLQKQVKDLQDELRNEEPSNIEEMQLHLKELKERYERAFEQMNQSKQYKKKADELIAHISTLYDEVEKLEKDLVDVKDVYDVLRGQNSKRISFERYLQIDYLDQIIYAANSRFKNLTDGQYHLVRSERQETHGRQSGLTIDVYDGYTGQMRDVKSLSGGEKFIASLCLALGMSDVIQSFQGNIRIDTMFIDEGFGSLDDESLHKSIDALVQLQETGRTIGVISHVNELKQMFPARLEVKKTKEGHSSASFILK